MQFWKSHRDAQLDPVSLFKVKLHFFKKCFTFLILTWLWSAGLYVSDQTPFKAFIIINILNINQKNFSFDGLILSAVWYNCFQLRAESLWAIWNNDILTEDWIQLETSQRDFCMFDVIVI